LPCHVHGTQIAFYYHSRLISIFNKVLILKIEGFGNITGQRLFDYFPGFCHELIPISYQVLYQVVDNEWYLISLVVYVFRFVLTDGKLWLGHSQALMVGLLCVTVVRRHYVVAGLASIDSEFCIW